ncbi:MAG: prepilin-type N-terminal cleavage/methylation domain-containing protein, partial [Phycisphaeraceae bacterium]|nr:prepilin-type N-terminal cleavage/methylation domain-containing protein [Phycisphaeraceae bacterium]
MITTSPKHQRRRRGYTLLEIMFSILILGVGMVAVASMFPVAARLQFNTLNDVRSQQAATNIVTMVQAKGFPTTTLETATNFDTTAGTTYPSQTNKLTMTVLNQFWPWEDRSF